MRLFMRFRSCSFLRPIALSMGSAFCLLISGIIFSPPTSAATCSITTNTVVNQAYVDSNSCSAINIQGNVSTTWIGTVDLQGSGTVAVKSTYTMTMGSSSEMILGSDDDFMVESNATTTVTPENLNGVKITARNITVSGAISAAEKGCRKGDPFGGAGYGPNVSTGLCAFTTGGYGRGGGGTGAGGGGGAYGGAGGGGGSSAAGGSELYGNSLVPSFLGSSGGTGYYSDAFGGPGGGIVHVTSTGILTINGTITANGAKGIYTGSFNGGGGGAGGSVMVHAGTLAGSGTIAANGGVGLMGGGGGGGGRAVVYYGTLSGFTIGNITASPGAGGAGGSYGNGVTGTGGTTYILDRYTDDGTGTLTINSGFDFAAGGDYTRDSINISSGAVLTCSSASTLVVSSTQWLVLSGITWTCAQAVANFTLGSSLGLSTTNTTFTFSAVTSATITVPTWTNVTTTMTMSLSGSYATFNVPSDLTLNSFTYTGSNAGGVSSNGGLLSINYPIALSLVSSTLTTGVSSTQLTTLSIDSRSTINATGKGCPGSATTENGFGPNVTTGVCAISTTGFGGGVFGGGGGGGGAAHAGTGGNGNIGGSGNTGGGAQSGTYGSSTQPVLHGSGGGGGYYLAPASGGNGGGRVYLIVSGVATINGPIKADGGAGLYGGSFNGGGGGSGGSIYLRAGTIAGGGAISANGGAGASTGGGGGGGGRIAIIYSALTFSGASSTTLGTGGTFAGSGTVGSIYTYQTNQTPALPTSLGPVNLVNGSTTSSATPIFTFILADPDITDTVKYRIQIDDSADFSSPAVDYTSVLAAQGLQSFQVGQAVGSGSYAAGSAGQVLSSGSWYWRVKTLDQVGSESSYTTANGGAIAFITDTVSRLLSFEAATASGLESVTATSIRIVLNTTHFQDVTVDYAIKTVSTTATGAGVDYTLSAGTATIPAGQTSTTIALVLINDQIAEPSEEVAISLSNPINALVGSNTTTAYTILDNDTAGVTLTESSGATTVTEGGAADTYTLVLTSQPTSTVQILLTTPSPEITLSTSTIEFTSSTWSTPVTVTVSATNDTIDESTDTALITHVLSVPSEFAYGYSSGIDIPNVTTTILDNDSAGVVLTESASATSVVEGGANDSYTLVLASQPTSTIRISLTTASAEIVLSTSTIEFTSSTWNVPVSVEVSAVNDLVAEPSAVAIITHILSVPSGFAYGYMSGVDIDSVTATVLDNDVAGVITAPTSAALIEGGSSSTYTVVLTSQPTSTVQVVLTVPSALATDQTVVSFTSGNWNTAQTINVDAQQNTALDGSRTAEIVHTTAVPTGFAYGYAGLPVDSFTATIADDDAASIALSTTALSATEGGDPATYSIVLGTAPTNTVQILLSPAAGLTLSTTVLTFTSSTWNSAQTITVTPVDDTRFTGLTRDLVITQTVSTTIADYAALRLANVVVTVSDDESSGGGASGAVGVAIPLPPTQIPPVIPVSPEPTVPVPPPSIPNEPLPPLPTGPTFFTIVNPDDIAQVVARFNDGERDAARETQMQTLLTKDLKTFGVKAPDQLTQDRLTIFLSYGLTPESADLGTGERRAILRDYLETIKLAPSALAKASPAVDLERLANGQIPLGRNITEERKQVQRALPTFERIFGHAPNFSNQEENLAWNTLLYRVRFPRDLEKEKEGIAAFRQTFRKLPVDPFQWATVRVLGYVQS